MTGRWRGVTLGLLIAMLLSAMTADELLQQAEEKIRAEQFAAAEPMLRQALKLDPSHAQALYRLGYVEYRQRKLAAAREHFSAVVKAAPPAYYSRYFLGRIALLENKPQEAVEWLEPVVAARQAVFDSTAQLGAAYAAAGMREKAVAALRTATTETPWDAALFYRLGRLYTQSGQKELAAEAFENSKRLRSASGEDVQTLMQVSELLGSGKQADALRAGAKIQDRPATDPNALVALGVIYGTGNLTKEALAAFERAAQTESAFFQAHYNHGLALLKLNRPAEAMEPLERAIKLLPQSVEASRAFGLAAVMNQRYQDAVVPLERVWKAEPADVRAGALLATALLRTGTPARAAAILSGTAFQSCSAAAPFLLRVEALNATENPTGALEAAQAASRCFPQDPQVELALAQQLARLGRYQEARPAFAEAVRRAPGWPEAELGLADTLSRSGEHAQAVDHYRAAMDNERTAIAARAGLARSLVALRRFEEARQTLEDSVARYPSQVALHIELSRVYARLGKPELAAEQTKIVDKLNSEAARP